MNSFTHTLLCCALLFLTLKELTEACSCGDFHSQQKFCNSHVVFRAKIIGESVVPFRSSQPDTYQYEIKMIKMFKGFKKIKDIRYVYTPTGSSLCGIRLELKKEYLLSGTIYDADVRVYLCGFHELWDKLSEFQRESLIQPHMGYQLGCECRMKSCSPGNCNLTKTECPWIDELAATLQTQHACIKSRDRSCSWYPSIPVKSTYNSHP